VTSGKAQSIACESPKWHDRVTFRAWQGTNFDLAWLGVSFVTILAFVVLNRGNKDVIN